MRSQTEILAALSSKNSCAQEEAVSLRLESWSSRTSGGRQTTLVAETIAVDEERMPGWNRGRVCLCDTVGSSGSGWQVSTASPGLVWRDAPDCWA